MYHVSNIMCWFLPLFVVLLDNFGLNVICVMFTFYYRSLIWQVHIVSREISAPTTTFIDPGSQQSLAFPTADIAHVILYNMKEAQGQKVATEEIIHGSVYITSLEARVRVNFHQFSDSHLPTSESCSANCAVPRIFLS